MTQQETKTTPPKHAEHAEHADPGSDASQDAPEAASADEDQDRGDASPRRSESGHSERATEGASTNSNGAAEQAAEPRPTAVATDELEAIAAERDKLKEQLLRTAADFDNFRKRTRREVEEAKMRGKDDAVRDLLPVFDNLERAVAATEHARDVESVVEGVRMVLKLFTDTAERMGLNRVESVGKRFDPNLHEAIQQQETTEHLPGTVVTEVMPGYMFGQRLIRAAMVIVARAPDKASDSESTAASDGPGKAPEPHASAGADQAPEQTEQEADQKADPDTGSETEGANGSGSAGQSESESKRPAASESEPSSSE